MMSIQKTAGALLCFLLWAQTTSLRAQTTGVGINTENLQGVFHVDAAIDNPPSGSVPPAQQADDVVVTEEGRVGIGTLTPSAKLHIRAQAGVFPLRIADGNEGVDKMLMSDDEGVATWQMPPLPPSSTMYGIQVAPRQNFPLGNSTQVTNSAFTVPEDGFYSADIRFWGEGVNVNGTTSTTLYWTITRLQLRKNGVVVDEFQYNEPSYTRVTCFLTLYTKASVSDVLSLWIYPVEGFSSGLTANPVAGVDYDWIKTKIQYKKLGVNDDTHYFD
jgi:hypothetical protein